MRKLSLEKVEPKYAQIIFRKGRAKIYLNLPLEKVEQKLNKFIFIKLLNYIIHFWLHLS